MIWREIKLIALGRTEEKLSFLQDFDIGVQLSLSNQLSPGLCQRRYRLLTSVPRQSASLSDESFSVPDLASEHRNMLVQTNRMLCLGVLFFLTTSTDGQLS